MCVCVTETPLVSLCVYVCGSDQNTSETQLTVADKMFTFDSILISRKLMSVNISSVSFALFASTDAVSVLVIMGCACCKQKKSAKAAAATSATVDITDLSPSNPDGGLSAALTQGRYCPDPTQSIPDFNKGFSSSAIFPTINTHQRSGCLTGTTESVCVCVWYAWYFSQCV